MFTRKDFEIFDDPTLAGRMNLIKTVIDPKFEALAPTIMAALPVPVEQPFYAHVAKHLRRFKNPPVDTWVAFSQNKRSYKAWPHFELGLWPDSLFIYFDVLDEGKAQVQTSLSAAELTKIFVDVPTDFVISNNHGAAPTQPATAENVAKMLTKFAQYKHSELVVGRQILIDDPLFDQPEALTTTIIETFKQLMKYYQPIMAAVARS